VIISLRDLSCASFRFGQVALHLFLDKERDFWGRRTPPLPSVKSPQQRPKPPFYFFGKKRKAHTRKGKKQVFSSSFDSRSAPARIVSKQTQTHTQTRRRKKERKRRDKSAATTTTRKTTRR